MSIIGKGLPVPVPGTSLADALPKLSPGLNGGLNGGSSAVSYTHLTLPTMAAG